MAQNRRTVLVTGVGFRAPDEFGRADNVFVSPGCKPNIGAYVALELTAAGHSVIIASRSGKKLDQVRDSLIEVRDSAEVAVAEVDLSDPASTRAMVDALPSGIHVDVVHSAGLSAGTYRVPDDNPYLPIEDVPLELPVREFDAAVTTLLVLVQQLLPRMSTQQRTRVVVIASMSGIRAYPLGYSHASAKAGVHHAVRTLALELNQRGIHVTEVNPGVVDTGLLDSPAAAEAMVTASKAFGYTFAADAVPMMPPREVGRIVAYVLGATAHILTVNVVPFGQEPHTGS